MISETSPSSSILTLCLLFDFPVTCWTSARNLCDWFPMVSKKSIKIQDSRFNLILSETSPSSSILTLCLLFDFPVTCCLVSKLLFAKGKGQAIYHTVLQGYALLGFKSIHIGSDAKPTKLTVNNSYGNFGVSI